MSEEMFILSLVIMITKGLKRDVCVIQPEDRMCGLSYPVRMMMSSKLRLSILHLRDVITLCVALDFEAGV